PSGPSNTYSFSILTIGSLRHSAFTLSFCLVSFFSLIRCFWRAASHSSRDTILGCGVLVMLLAYGAAVCSITETIFPAGSLNHAMVGPFNPFLVRLEVRQIVLFASPP